MQKKYSKQTTQKMLKVLSRLGVELYKKVKEYLATIIRYI